MLSKSEERRHSNVFGGSDVVNVVNAVISYKKLHAPPKSVLVTSMVFEKRRTR